DAELSSISGSGIGGRISKKDIEDYVAKRAQPAAANGEQRQRGAEAPPRPAGVAAVPGTPVPLSPMRRAIASNMVRSKQTIPHAWTVAEVEMSNVVRFRQQARDGFKQKEGIVLTFVPIIASPQAGILAMDAIVKRPVVVDGDAIAVRSMMNLCLSFDHRVLDGVSAARFLQGVRRWLEGFSEQIPVY